MGRVQDYLTEPARAEAVLCSRFAGRVTSPGPARPVFRANTDMMLLTTRLRIDPDGQPHMPGNLDLEDLSPASSGKYRRQADAGRRPVGKISGRRSGGPVRTVPQSGGKRAAEDLHGPQRPRPLPRETSGAGHRRPADARIHGFTAPSDPALTRPGGARRSHRAIPRRGRAIDRLRISSCTRMRRACCNRWPVCGRSSAAGHALQPATAEEALDAVAAPFPEVQDERDLFDAGRDGLTVLLATCGADRKAQSAGPLLDLLAGGARAHPIRDAHASWSRR